MAISVLVLGIQEWLSIRQSLNVINLSNKVKEKKQSIMAFSQQMDKDYLKSILAPD